jgi:hypothetical protein
MPKKYQDSDPPLGGNLYARGTYIKGGTYMLVNTVGELRKCHHLQFLAHSLTLVSNRIWVTASTGALLMWQGEIYCVSVVGMLLYGVATARGRAS